MKRVKAKGRPYKYSNKQIRYFASMSKGKKQWKWMNRLYKQKIKQAVRSGETGRIPYIKQAQATSRARIKMFGVKRQTWTIATKNDIDEFFISGKPNKAQGKLLILDTEGNAIKIAYEGTEVFNEIIDERTKWFEQNNIKQDDTKSIDEILKEKGVI